MVTGSAATLAATSAWNSAEAVVRSRYQDKEVHDRQRYEKELHAWLDRPETQCQDQVLKGALDLREVRAISFLLFFLSACLGRVIAILLPGSSGMMSFPSMRHCRQSNASPILDTVQRLSSSFWMHGGRIRHCKEHMGSHLVCLSGSGWYSAGSDPILIFLKVTESNSGSQAAYPNPNSSGLGGFFALNFWTRKGCRFERPR